MVVPSAANLCGAVEKAEAGHTFEESHSPPNTEPVQFQESSCSETVAASTHNGSEHKTAVVEHIARKGT